MKRLTVILPIAVVVTVGIIAVFALKGGQPSASAGAKDGPAAATDERQSSPEPKETTTAPATVISVAGGNFFFAPNAMTAKKGDRIRVIFRNDDGFHDFRIDELGVATERIGAGQSETVEFTADRAGTFEYYCSVGSHRAMGMKGTLTVTE